MAAAESKKGKTEPKKVAYQDPLWSFFDNTVDKIVPHRQTILYGIVGLIAILVIGSIAYTISSHQQNNAQAALSQALEIYNAEVASATPPPPGTQNSKKKTYPDEQQKYKEAATAFDNVAANYSSISGLARYYAAMSRTHFDQAKAQTDLEALSKEGGDVGFWARVGIAELYAATGQTDKAITAYQQFKDNPGSLPKSVIYYNLGYLLERAGKNTEAADAYFQAASADRSSAEGRKADDRLTVLNPDLKKKLPPEKKDQDDI